MLASAGRKEHHFKEHLLVSASKTPVLESLFNSKYCEIFKNTYFEENLERLPLRKFVQETEKNQKRH